MLGRNFCAQISRNLKKKKKRIRLNINAFCPKQQDKQEKNVCNFENVICLCKQSW